MKGITRLSLALIMFSLFSISYFVTSAIGEDCAGMGNPAAVASCWAKQSGATGTMGHNPAPGTMGQDPAAHLGTVSNHAIRQQLMKTAPLCREEVQVKYDEKRSIHFGKASPPFPPMGADGKDNERINAQELIELEKCQQCPTMWMVADKSQETGIRGTHVGSGTVTCMKPSDAAVAAGAK
jgi:hypothetical protein